MIKKKILHIGAFWPECQLRFTRDFPWYCFADVFETTNFTLKQYIEYVELGMLQIGSFLSWAIKSIQGRMKKLTGKTNKNKF